MAWLVIPPVLSLLRRAPAELGTIRGRTVGQLQARQAQITCHLLNILAPHLDMFRASQYMGTLARGIIFRNEQQVTGDVRWRYLVLLYEAEDTGIRTTEGEVENYLFSMPAFASDGRLDQQRYQAFLRFFRLTDRDVRVALRDLIKVFKLISLRMESVHATGAELWSQYAFRNEQAKVRFVALRPELFLPLVEANEAALRDFYEAHKDDIADSRSGTVGYKSPKRARVACALAAYEDFEKDMTVTEAEIQGYYEEHKDEFVLPEQKGEEEPAVEGAEEESPALENAPSGDETNSDKPTQSPVSSAEGDAEGGEKVGEIRPASQEGTGEAEEEVRYRDLEEVRDDIEDRIRRRKAEEAASEACERAFEDIQEVMPQYVNEPLPLDQMARRRKLRYMVLKNEAGREFLSRDELDELPLAISGIGSFAMDQELYFASQFDSPGGPCICQVLARRDPQVEPYESVKERVREDYMEEKALEEAQRMADELVEESAKSSLDEAVAELNVRLKSLVARNKNGHEKEAKQQAEPGDPQAEEGTEPEGILTIEETDFFSRSALFVPAMGGLRPQVIKKAFSLHRGQVASVVDGGPERICYVIEKVDRRDADPVRFYQLLGELRRGYLITKQIATLTSWVQQLVKESEPVEQM